MMNTLRGWVLICYLMPSLRASLQVLHTVRATAGLESTEVLAWCYSVLSIQVTFNGIATVHQNDYAGG